ncbi:MAG: hypothetical protein LOY58_13735 [Gammaproteobacteria bacterium]|jgi:hypothetical protein|nr:hypothetical protein [Gammaproteobacteria bacterium]
MADLFRVTAPLLIRAPAGERHIMVERFPLAGECGLVYFEPYWHLQRPASRAIHRVVGEIRGDGPWKVGDSVVTVLGCHGTDPELANAFSEWQAYLQAGAPGYPDRSAILALAEANGARIG